LAASRIPTIQSEDNQTVVKERIFLDKIKPDLLYDEITTIDHALTRPWTVTKSYRRERNPVWFSNECAEDNHHVTIGKDDYFIGADGLLMPVKKDQPRLALFPSVEQVMDDLFSLLTSPIGPHAKSTQHPLLRRCWGTSGLRLVRSIYEYAA
jgi:hypothetical protein